jgi:futalosine hydrolase
MIERIPCAQIRAVSNFIEKRNRDNWNIALAIKNLNETAIEIINNL